MIMSDPAALPCYNINSAGRLRRAGAGIRPRPDCDDNYCDIMFVYFYIVIITRQYI